MSLNVNAHFYSCFDVDVYFLLVVDYGYCWISYFSYLCVSLDLFQQLWIALIEIYAKCGSIKKERVLFDKMCYEHTIMWIAMIGKYARNGYRKETIKLFEQMEHLGLSKNYIMFIILSSTCIHVGLVKEGYQYFKSMNNYYGWSFWQCWKRLHK